MRMRQMFSIPGGWLRPAVILAVAAAALLFLPGIASAQPPATPSSVSVTRADGTLTATWDAPDGATSYHVTYSSDGGGSWALAAFSHTQTSITISNVSNTSTYIVGVRAYNGQDWSGWRNSPAAGPYTPPQPTPTPTNPPAAVAGISGTRGDGTLTASWTSVATATHYHVTYSDNGGGSWSLAAYAHPAASPTTGITFGVDNGKTYMVAVRAWNAAGWSGWTNSAAINPYYANPPAFPPAAIASIDTARSGSTLTASWEAVSTASKYHVNYSENGGGSWSVAAMQHPAATPRTSINIAIDPAKTYVVAARAGNNGGWSGWTNSDSSAPNSLAAPASVTLAHNGTTLAASWDAVTDAFCYNVEMRDSAGGSWLPILSGATGTSATLTAPNHRSSYEIRVQALTEGGAGSPWTASAVAHPSMQPPAMPYWIKLKRTGYNTVQATWNAVPNQTGYTVEHSDDNGASWTPVSAGANLSSAQFNLAVGKTYKARVKASNVYGDSQWRYSAALPSPTLSIEGFLDYGEMKLGNFGGEWWYQADVGPHASCQGPVSGGSLTVSGLAYATDYTYSVYDNAACKGSAPFETTAVTVSNVGQAEGNRCIVGRFFNKDTLCAVGFTTGNASGGYTLTSIAASFQNKVGTPGKITVAIHAADTTNSINPADTALVTLSGSNPGTAGNYTYTCDGAGCSLAANTTYFVVMLADTPGGGDDYYLWDRTATEDETKSPSNNGWSIADLSRGKSGGDWVLGDPSKTQMVTIAADALAPPANATLKPVARPVSFTTLTPLDFLTASHVQPTAARLNMNHQYTGVNWYYRQHGYNSCVEAPGGSVDLTGLTAGTLYGYSAYWNPSCLAFTEIGRTNFTTADAGVGNLTNLLDGGCVIGKPSGATERQCAAAFTTGKNTGGGYWLEDVTVQLGIDGGGTISTKVALHSADANGAPTARPMAMLGSTGSKARGSYTFTCLGTGVCDLENETKYFIVVSAPHAAYNFWRKWETRNSGQGYGWAAGGGWAIVPGAMSKTGSGEWTENGAAGKTPVFHVSAKKISARLEARTVQATQASLHISGHDGPWYVNSIQSPHDTTCTAISNGTRIDATGLTAETDYVFTAYSDSGCTTPIASTAFTTLATATLTATVQSDDTVYLTLSDGPDDWWFRIGHGCHATSGNRYPTTGGIAGYTGTHTVTAYSDSSCTTQIATASFTVT